MNIVAFDPGFTTGVAFYNEWAEPDGPYWTSEVAGLKALWNIIHEEAPYDRVVYESFLYQRRDKVDLRPVEAIGVIRLYCILSDIIPVAQTPAHGKRFWTDDKIKKIGLWEPGKVHAMDALRHLLYYQAFQLNQTHLLERLKDD